MTYGETLKGVEFQSNNGSLFRCFIGESGAITFQISVGVNGLESVFEPNDKKELSKLLALLVLWVGIDESKKIIEKLGLRRGSNG
jgi:hypothetical protein